MELPLQAIGGGTHIVCLSDDVAQEFLSKGHKRILCTLDSHLELHMAIMKKKEGPYYLRIGKKHMKALDKGHGEWVKIVLEEDTSPNQFEQSEVWVEVLSSDPEALEAWEKLTEGRKRSLIYVVKGVKSIEKQIERALKITKKLKLGISNPKGILK